MWQIHQLIELWAKHFNGSGLWIKYIKYLFVTKHDTVNRSHTHTHRDTHTETHTQTYIYRQTQALHTYTHTPITVTKYETINIIGKY